MEKLDDKDWLRKSLNHITRKIYNKIKPFNYEDIEECNDKEFKDLLKDGPFKC